MKRRRPDWRQELAKRPTKRQREAMDALHRPKAPQTIDERPTFFDELDNDPARD